MKTHFLVVCVATLCCSCSSQKPSLSNFSLPAFDPERAKYIEKTGSTLIRGEAFIIGKRGKPIFAAGETIRLVPATKYATARFQKLYRGKTFIRADDIPKVRPDPRYTRLTRTTIASARGKFEFDRVAPGNYFVTAQKIIRTPGKFSATGGAMYAKITITGKEKWPTKVVIADR